MSVISKFIVCSLIFLQYNCEKKFDPQDNTVECILSNQIAKSTIANDSFNFFGLVDDKEWKANFYTCVIYKRHEYCDIGGLPIYFRFFEKDNKCKISETLTSHPICFKGINDTVFLNEELPQFRIGLEILRTETVNNDLIEQFGVNRNDLNSKSTYFVLQEVNKDTSIITGSFQLDLRGEKNRNANFLIKNGRFRCKTWK
ncbi:MAG TPA: hypothetical protein PKD85_08700 [Saprospiraceae bacterium]|nr:hypothetical protein [Saprospiraceae bacterium]